jgi:hypothetical protein
MSEIKRKCWVIQKPPVKQHFDMGAIERLGELNYIIPSAPNIHEHERISEDFSRMLAAIEQADAEDVVIPLGGSPFSNWLFGAALYASGKESINTAVYSRSMDNDGRRGDTGDYRVIEMATKFPEPVDEKEVV